MPDADTRPTHGIAMFRCTPSTVPDSSFSATRHIPVTDCQPGDIQAGYGNAVLVDRPFGLPSVPSTVDVTVVLNAAARLIYHMRSADHIDALVKSSLAARPTAD